MAATIAIATTITAIIIAIAITVAIATAVGIVAIAGMVDKWGEGCMVGGIGITTAVDVAVGSISIGSSSIVFRTGFGGFVFYDELTLAFLANIHASTIYIKDSGASHAFDLPFLYQSIDEFIIRRI